MDFTFNDYSDGTCTTTQWINQFDPIELELGKVYRQKSSSWSEMHYKIIFVDDKIAIGVSVYNQISNKFIGDYCLFYVKNGFKYEDIGRPCYRLIEVIK